MYNNPDKDDNRKTMALHIKRVSDRDTGRFQCNAVAGASSTSYGFSITVIKGNQMPGIKVTSRQLIVSFGEEVDLRCQFITSTYSRKLVKGVWIKDGEFYSNRTNQGLLSASLNVKVNEPSDGGLYTCILMTELRYLRYARQYNMTRSAIITVRPKFFTDDLKQNVVVFKGKSVNLTCSVKGNPLKTEWKIHLDNLHRKARSLGTSGNSTFQFSNLDKLENHTLTVVNVTLSDQGKYYCCIHNDSRKEEDIKECQVFTIKVKDGNSTSAKLENILYMATAIGLGKYNASNILGELRNTTNANVTLLAEDLDITLKILSILANHEKVNIISGKDQQEFLEICSNILQPVNVDSWKQFDHEQSKKKEKTLWFRLVSVVDTYGVVLAKQLARNSSKLIETSNAAMRLDRIGQENQARKSGLMFDYKKFESSLNLPAEVFRGDEENYVVSVAYKTLSAVMGLHGINKIVNQEEIEVLTPNSTIFSSVIEPPLSGRLDKRTIKITLKNSKVVEEAVRQTCMFWKEGLPETWMTDGCTLVPSESNKHVTTCECDHLTIFASLMDPYGAVISEENRKALELISSIGCSISLFAVILTMAVTLFFWKVLKSPRTIVLMNICLAIGIVCILVIVEGTARATKVGCTVMAVLLHFFLLAVFCWFLCEGILLYFLFVKVIGGEVEEKVKFFVLFGWGFPLLVVSISLGVTKIEGYGYHGQQSACWLSVDNGLIWAFIGPVIFVLLVNLVVFILVMRQMMGTRQVQKKLRDEKLKVAVKATAVLLPLLGITWVFGLLTFNTATLVFKYIFAILNSLQGLMIFIFHCLLNPQINDAMKKLQKRMTDEPQVFSSRSQQNKVTADTPDFHNSSKGRETDQTTTETLQSEMPCSTHF